MIRGRDLVMMVAGAVFGAITLPHAGEVAIEYGQMHFKSSENGVLWQADYKTDNYLTPSYALISWTDKFSKNGRLGYEIAGWFTGTFAARDNTAIMNDDGFRNIPCDPSNNVYTGCHAAFNAAGKMRALNLGLTYDVPVGMFTVVPEIGVRFFKDYVNVRSTPIDYPAVPPAPFGEVKMESSWTDMPTAFAGLAIKWKSSYIKALYHSPAQHRALSVTNRAGWQIGVGAILWSGS